MQQAQPNTPQIKPWTRFFARALDISLFTFLSLAFFSRTFPLLALPLPQPEILSAFLILFIWVFVESILLTTWGTTPGKWLLKTQLREATGKKLTFPHALRRSLTVWFKGIAIGLPLIPIITMLVARHHLIKNGITTWDQKNNLVLTHQNVSMLRVLFAIILLIAAISMGDILQLATLGQ